MVKSQARSTYGETKPGRMLIVIRVKGSANMVTDVRATLAQLSLHRVFSARLLPSTPENVGMLNRIKDVICWGEIDKEGLKSLIAKRGRLVGNRRVNDENLRTCCGFESIDALVEALLGLSLKHSDVEGMKPIFRLSPPRGGFKVAKKQGSIGYLGTRVSDLLTRML